MAIIKVYNKEGKIKLLSRESTTMKIVDLIRYDMDIKRIHTFTYHKRDVNKDRTTYYDYMALDDGIKERIWITDREMEHWEDYGGGKSLKTNKVFSSGNIYEERTIKAGDEIIKSMFRNGKFENLITTIQESKINEYLKRLDYGK